MAKAKDHAAKYRQRVQDGASDVDAQRRTVKDLVNEMQWLIRDRKATRRDAVVACVREIENKAKAVGNLIDSPNFHLIFVATVAYNVDRDTFFTVFGYTSDTVTVWEIAQGARELEAMKEWLVLMRS